MSTIVVNFTKISPRSTIASNRIAEFVAKQLNATLVDTLEGAQAQLAAGAAFDAAIFVNGMWGFCDFRPEALEIAKRAQRLYWVSNDYAIKMPSVLKRLAHVRLATFDNYDAHPAHVYVNWNKLTHEPFNGLNVPTRRGLTYYGAFREGRIDSFRRYFGAEPAYPVTIYTTRNNRGKYETLAPKAEVLTDPIKPTVDGRTWQASLYIEDDESHRVYHSPANRFYEMLSTGTLMLVDAAAEATLRRAGFDVGPWVVRSQADVEGALAAADGLRQTQQARFGGVDHRAALTADFMAFAGLHGLVSRG